MDVVQILNMELQQHPKVRDICPVNYIVVMLQTAYLSESGSALPSWLLLLQATGFCLSSRLVREISYHNNVYQWCI